MVRTEWLLAANVHGRALNPARRDLTAQFHFIDQFTPGGIDEDASRLKLAQPLGVQQVFAFGREACHHDDDVALLQELVEPYKSDTLTALVRRACREIGRASCRDRVCQYV